MLILYLQIFKYIYIHLISHNYICICIYIYIYTQNDLPEYPQGIFVLAPRTPPSRSTHPPCFSTRRGEKRLDLRYRAMEKLGWMAESRGAVPGPGKKRPLSGEAGFGVG